MGLSKGWGSRETILRWLRGGKKMYGFGRGFECDVITVEVLIDVLIDVLIGGSNRVLMWTSLFVDRALEGGQGFDPLSLNCPIFWCGNFSTNTPIFLRKTKTKLKDLLFSYQKVYYLQYNIYFLSLSSLDSQSDLSLTILHTLEFGLPQ